MTDISRTCNLCGEMMTGGPSGFVAHGEQHHPNHFLNGSEKSGRYEFAEKVYFCPLDDRWYSSKKHLSRTIKRFGLTNEEYFNVYGETFLPDLWNQNNNDPKYGNACASPTCLQCSTKVNFNQMKWHYPKFCCFSCSTSWHAQHTDRVETAQRTLKERRQTNPDLALKPNHIRYWTNQGMSEQEAVAKVKERQQTNTLARFQQRYGVEEGQKRWLDRQEKWFDGLKKSGMHTGISKISNRLFEKVSQHYPDILYGQNEKQVKTATSTYWLDCTLNNKVIEFFGDYWHGNPDMYAPDHKMAGSTAAELQKRDQKKIRDLVALGYDVMVIWENEYNINPDIVMGKCLGFLASAKPL